MKHLVRISVPAALLASFTPVAQAHPGHHTFSDGISHAITSGHHLAIIAAAGGVLFLLGFAANKTPLRRSLQSIGALLALAAAAWSFV